MNKSSVIIIGILSITILVLAGFIVLGNNKETEKTTLPVLGMGVESKDVTEDFCIDLAKDAVKKYEKCIELGSTEIGLQLGKGNLVGKVLIV